MTRPVGRLSAVVAMLVIVSIASPALFAGSTLADDSTQEKPTCKTEVAHDAFLSDETLVTKFNETGSASTIQHNTRVTVSETTSFYRVKGENPNSYCVHITVAVSPKILPPTNLGTVSSNNEVTTAEWQDVLNFDSQKAHTEITFTMPPNSTVLFAPSKPTVLIPAWRDKKKHKAESIIASIMDTFRDDEKPLEKRTYTFSANGSPSVTIPLTNRDDENQTITEWRAVYRTSSDEPWTPVDTESSAPVFYQAGDDEVRFYFNNKDAKVQFTANPTLRDKGRWEVRSFWRSIHDLGSLWPLATLPSTGGIAW